MRNTFRDYGDNRIDRQKKRSAVRIVTVISAFLVAGIVMWQMILPGVAMQSTPHCGIEEHTHSDACYTEELTCGQEETEEHQHTDACYTRTLTCGKEEHVHTDACYSDSTADVENEDTWKQSFANVQSGDDWGENVAAIAVTQIGYQESENNYIVAENNEHKGYTRYGNWAGTEYIYGNWDTTFAEFCIHYAGVPDTAFPMNADINEWIQLLQKNDLYVGSDSAEYQPGDLIFLQKKNQETESQIGIIEKTEDKNGKTYISVIEGNCENQVRRNEYAADDENISGYGLISKAQIRYTQAQMGEQSENIAETEISDTQQETGEQDVSGNENESSDAATVQEGDTTDSTIDERVTVNVSAKDATSNGKNGQTLYVNVNSTCANAELDKDVKVRIDISDFPEGVTLAGFSDNKMTIHYGNNNSQTMEIQLKEENGKKYVEFTQPAGSTVNFDLTFNSENGIMGKESQVTVTPSIVDPTDKDHCSGSATLTWTGKNVWKNLKKTVDKTEIEVERDSNDKDQLVGKLHYTITAEQANGDGSRDTGAIWTKEVTLNDTLTLPEGMSFPEGSKVDLAQKAIVDADGNVIFSFTNLDSDKIKDISLDGKNIHYTIVIPNPHMKDGVPTEEMDNVNLKCDLDVSRLVVENNYTSQDQADQDKIINDVTIDTTAYKGDDTYHDTKEVSSNPKLSTGFELTKTADKEEKNVTPGETIKYTITVSNTGNLVMTGKDENGDITYVTDTLPKYLELTDAQKKALEAKGAVIDENGVIKWAPGEIEAGESKTLEFEVNVKSAEDMKEVADNTTIKNDASYLGKTDSSKVTYKKPKLEIKKISDKAEVSNGDTITYQITIENKEDFETVEQIIEDTLQNGLIFQNMVDKDGNVLSSGGRFQAESTASGGKHDVELVQDGQKLTWNLGTLGANEKVTLYYTCKVDTDKLDSGVTQIKNSAKSTTTGEKSGNTGTNVTNPVSIDKKVNNTDGGGTYNPGEILDYSITIKNDNGDQASKKTDVILTDQLPAGLIPEGYKLYKIANGKTWGTDLQESDLVECSFTFEQYLTSWNDYWDQYYYTVINGEIVRVSRSYDNGGNLNKTKLEWYIGSMEPGESITKSYKTKLYMLDSQLESGNKLTYTNTASGGGASDSVTIYGKEETGTIELTKQVKGYTKYDQLTEEQKEAIKFRITCSNPQYSKEISLAEFTRTDSESAKYVLSRLPYGEYTIEEISSELTGMTNTITITGGDSGTANGNSVKVTLSSASDKQTAQVKFKNEYENADTAKVDIQKSVWGIRDLSNQWNYNALSNKYMFDISNNIGQYKGNYVIYNISVFNTGDKDVHIKDLIDELPEGVEYVGIRGELNNSTPADFGNTTQTDRWNANGKIQVGNVELIAGKTIESSVSQNGRKVSFQIGGNNGMDIGKNQGITFFVMCKVSPDVELDVPLENTAKLIVDSDVEYKEYGTIKMQGTTDDGYQNNGGTTDEGINSDGNRVISSSVSIMPTKVVVPGIKKTAKAYIETGKTGKDMIDITDSNRKNNIQPQATIKWEIELLNDGTVPIKEYMIKDEVDSPFYILRKSDAQELQITDSQYKVFHLEIKDQWNNTVKEKDLSETVWSQIGNNKKQSVTLNINDSDLIIPVGGKAVFTVYTKNDDFANAIYNNNAVFTPTVDNNAKFDANSVTNGELVSDSNGTYIGVKASDSVYALGDYGSFSWKTVEEKADSDNYGVGYDASRNYISIDDDTSDKKVVYSNNIENVSKNDFRNMVITDLMPYEGDTGVLNQNDRGSQFTVKYTGNMEIFIKSSESDTNPKKLTEGTDYTVKFSSKSSFTDNEMRGILGEEWHDTWQDGDKAFSVIMSDSFKLEPGQIMTMKYEGEASEDANPGSIAWNSFGYSYNARNATASSDLELRAEPPKVGLKIQNKPTIEKEVVDGNGNTLPYDASKKFTFAIYEGTTVTGTPLATFEICQGGSIKLKDLKNNGVSILQKGHQYTITETNANGHTFVGVGEKGNQLSTVNLYTFTYNTDQDFTILFRNRYESYELPATGGVGTTGYLAGGAALMCLAALLYGYQMRRKRERGTK